jgi:hypothetical protein
LPPEQQVALHTELAARAELDGAELELLGALAAGPRGTSARARLLTLLAAAHGRDRGLLVRALDRAAEELRRALLDEDFADFVAAVQSATADSGHPLHQSLRAPLWPPPVLPPARPLALSDRRLPAGI